MHTDDRDCIVGNWSRLVERNVLFDRELHNAFLPTAESVGVFADVLSWEGMFHYLEWTHDGENRSIDLRGCR